MVSIILPVYNSEYYLEDCLLSILNQTFEAFELIIIDDGSTDNSINIIKRFEHSDRRIVAVYKINSGITNTLNKGISLAKYNIICRMDADDISHPQRLEKQIKLIEDYDIIGSNASLINDKGKIIGKVVLPKFNKEIEQSLLRYKPSLIHPSIMFNKKKVKLFQNNLVYNEDFMVAQDLDLWIRNLRSCRFYNIQENLIQLRKHPSNVSSVRSEEQLINSIIIVESFKRNLSIDSGQIRRLRQILLKDLKDWKRTALSKALRFMLPGRFHQYIEHRIKHIIIKNTINSLYD